MYSNEKKAGGKSIFRKEWVKKEEMQCFTERKMFLLLWTALKKHKQYCINVLVKCVSSYPNRSCYSVFYVSSYDVITSDSEFLGDQ